jgi:hypothetical protein
MLCGQDSVLRLVLSLRSHDYPFDVTSQTQLTRTGRGRGARCRGTRLVQSASGPSAGRPITVPDVPHSVRLAA